MAKVVVTKQDNNANALAPLGEQALAWSGDELKIRSAAAKEAGLDVAAVEADYFTAGFRTAIVVDDPFDGAIVARGRTVLKDRELFRALRPALQYLGVRKDDYKVKVSGGRFELRVSKQVADASAPALDSAKRTLQIFVGFGLAGLASYMYGPIFLAGILWGIGLLGGGWQLRRGVASGRAMLSARVAVALGMLAQEEQLILPPAPEDGALS